MNREILFEKFEIVETLKKDEFAGVYLANHIYLSKEIILKVLDTSVLPDNSIIERFKREAKILARLDHPNIIKVLDFGAYDQFFYISFEYFESKNLRAFIKDRLPEDLNRNLIVQLFEGLNYAHQHQIIHRDIKPENILVNEDHLLKIGDFGLALGVNDKLVTSQYSVVGTPCYMSPEQVLGGQLDVRSDLFSAGIVSLELLTGKNPFLGKDINETINKVISYDEKELFKSLSVTQNDLKNLLNGLLRKEASDRFENAGQALCILNVKEAKPVLEKKSRKKFLYLLSLIVIIVALIIYMQFRNTSQPISNPNQQSLNLNKVEVPENNTTNSLEKKPELKNEVKDKIPAEQPVKLKNDKVKTPENTIPKTIFGKLMVECIPWANIYINSEKFDTTPLEKPISLPYGEYEVKLVHPDYPAYSTRIKINSENLNFVKVKLDTLFGFLRCEVFPWGEIFVNGKSYGQTPLQSAIRLAPGVYNLTIKNSDLNPHFETINIKRNQTLTIKHKFEIEKK